MKKRLTEAERQHTLAEYDVARKQQGVDWGRCFCGCERETKIYNRTDRQLGYVPGKPARFIQGHYSKSLAPIDHSSKYRIDQTTGCWVWQGSVFSSDRMHKYGQLHVTRHPVLAHRYFYEKHVGPIPEGHQLHHVCVEKGYGTTLCVNPAHLKPLTPAIHARFSPTTKLDIETVGEIRRLLAAGDWGHAAIGHRFGVSRRLISNIANGDIWI